MGLIRIDLPNTQSGPSIRTARSSEDALRNIGDAAARARGRSARKLPPQRQQPSTSQPRAALHRHRGIL